MKAAVLPSTLDVGSEQVGPRPCNVAALSPIHQFTA